MSGTIASGLKVQNGDSLYSFKGVNLSLQVLAPLVKVLWFVDDNRSPSMALMFGGLEHAKKELKRLKGSVNAYKPILELIDAKTKDQPDSPYHLAGSLLNPSYYHTDDDVTNPLVKEATITCVEFFAVDFDTEMKRSTWNYQSTWIQKISL